jgi:integrase
VSAAFRKGKARHLQIYVPCRTGYVQRSCGTPNSAIARKMRAMVKTLKDDHEWDLLDAIRAKRLSLPTLYDYFASERLAEAKAILADADVCHHLDAWEASVRATVGDTGTAERYRQQVETLTGESMLVSAVTSERVAAWLAGLAVTPGTRRKYVAALASFVSYLRTVRVLPVNPLAEMKLPKENPPRLRWESLERCKALVDAQPEPFRSLSALIHATGAELSPALRMTRGDVDLERMLAHVPGTKTRTRDRHDVVIEAWAKSYLARHCATLAPLAPLFPGITRFRAYEAHAAACKAIGVSDYRIHDARHSIAVRWRKRGVLLEVIAAQLGHATIAQVVERYGRFTPTVDERREEVAR